MSNAANKPERATQDRVIRLFQEQLGYRFLGDWRERAGNSNIEDALLTPWLSARGYSEAQISTALYRLRTEANNKHRDLYANNQAVYQRLRYGVAVKTLASQPAETVWLIDWQEPTRNDFALAEEVTLIGGQERRPDLVLYVNGLALGVLELKNSRKSLGDGIRQNLSNQQPDSNAWFFSTMQFVFAGNDSQGLRYGTVGTVEKYFLTWKEDEQDATGYTLDKYLAKLCRKERFIELARDFVLFDGGIKKLPRVHQYFGIKAAQGHVQRRQGGIIWHTQGSGKSIVMVLLARWILETYPNARVVIITDRDELDKQIEGVFTTAGEAIERALSGRDLLAKLGEAKPRLLCSLVHKFGKREVADFDAYLKELESQPCAVQGELFVFVDECHRTQSGRLHRAMKAILPHAVFIGFTGTPLLKQDKATSLEVFGGYIHTYKFSEAVEDGVVLDLVYEARDIDQRLGSPEKIEEWFAAKTQGLNDWQKQKLREQWGTLQKVLSSKARMGRIVSDLVFDFSTKPRLVSERGNAMLVASSIYEACRYFELFQNTPLRGRCAVITSYNPNAQDVTREEVGAQTEADKQFIYTCYQRLLDGVTARPGKSKTETYEDAAKQQFKEQPARMKLLIVVDKLLTGFDAPPCTYLYLDKSMQDHGLFQAICRTNRLDGADKDFGYIVDYMDLFKKVENAIAVYSSELDDSAGGVSPEVLLKDRLTKGREALDAALEAIELLCEPVEPPKGDLQYLHSFCGNSEHPDDLAAREPQRTMLYQCVAALTRAYANIADELAGAGYSRDAQLRIKQRVEHYLAVRDLIRQASGEAIDLKAYEADMRYLIDTYIEADAARTISPFEDVSLLDLVVKSGIAEAITAKLGQRAHNQETVAETIENNVRAKIVKEHLNNPAFYQRLSELLAEIIRHRREKALKYEEYLRQINDLIRQVQTGHGTDLPESLDTQGKQVLYQNLDQDEALALRIDAAVREVRPDGWRGVEPKERVIKGALYRELKDKDAVERLFDIIRSQAEY